MNGYRRLSVHVINYDIVHIVMNEISSCYDDDFVDYKVHNMSYYDANSEISNTS